MTQHVEVGKRIAGRYVVEAALGSGGMASVYGVSDAVDGRRVALKLLHASNREERHADKLLASFEREYFTLVQLAHPRVVAVYDYAVADTGPYYTMELLDGTDLRERAPVPWRVACSILRDVASCLALLHARRIVHRDLTPRNVRCTSDGRAKLIDFGAMAPFGPAAFVFGTPAYIAPEVLHGQALDARTDLFALGGTLYFALTGRVAYPAQGLNDLSLVWQHAPTPLGSLVSDLPAALEKLVMELLNLDPLARPASAAEVISLLSAIAALPPADDLGLAKAYLETPKLIGREDEMAKVTRCLAAAAKGEGATLLVRGEPGSGRSRFLAMALLEAKVAGATGVRARCAELEQTPYSTVRALFDELWTARPDLAVAAFEPHRRELGHLFPALSGELRDLAEADTPPTAAPLMAPVQRALVASALALCERTVLVVAVDDFERCDSASVAVLLEVAHLAPKQRLVLLLALPTEAASAKLPASFVERGRAVVLDALTQDQVTALLGSLFDDAPNLSVVADFIYRVGQGNPRTTLELARDLVQRDIAQLRNETWHLPSQLRGLELPDSVEHALRLRVADLSSAARYIATALATATVFAPLEFAELVTLMRDRAATAEIYEALAELTVRGIIGSLGATYTLRDAAVGGTLRAALSQEAARALHRALAELYVRRNHARWNIIASQHFYRGGMPERALEYSGSALLLVSTGLAEQGSVFSRTVEGVIYHEALLDHVLESHCSARIVYGRRKILMLLAASTDPALTRHGAATIEQLKGDLGLLYMDDTDPTLDLGTRAVACMQRARVIWEQAPITERGLHPLEALVELGTIAAALSSLYARTFDTRGFGELPALIAPFRAIPAIAFVERVVQMAGSSIVSGACVIAQRRTLLKELEQPIAGVEPLVAEGARGIVLYYLGLDLSLRGDPEALQCAERIDLLLHYEALAWHVRTVFYAHAGDARDMERSRRRLEALALREGDIEHHLRVGVAYTLVGTVWAGDLQLLSRELPLFEAEAARFAGWLPWCHYLRGAHHSLRGELTLARKEYEAGLQLLAAGQHQAWWTLTAAHLQLLVDMQDYALAGQLARAAEAKAMLWSVEPAEPIGFQIALALAEAHSGELQKGSARLQAVLLLAHEQKRAGLSVGIVHEAIAKLALLAGDNDTFETHTHLTGECYRLLRRPALLARYERLMQTTRPTQRPLISDVPQQPQGQEPQQDGDNETLTDLS